MGLGDVERGEDQPVGEAVPQVADDRELVLRVGAGRVEHQAQPLSRVASWIDATIVV